jgi:hypothetical protein
VIDLIMRVLGTQRLDFTTADGNRINGVKIHGAFKDANVEGLAVEAFFINAENKSFELPEGITANSEVDITFNRKGKIEAINIIPSTAAKA